MTETQKCQCSKATLPIVCKSFIFHLKKAECKTFFYHSGIIQGFVTSSVCNLQQTVTKHFGGKLKAFLKTQHTQTRKSKVNAQFLNEFYMQPPKSPSRAFTGIKLRGLSIVHIFYEWMIQQIFRNF